MSHISCADKFADVTACDTMGAMKNLPRTVAFFRRPRNPRAAQWELRIRRFLTERFPHVRIVRTNAELVIVLGGDGTIIEAARSTAGRTLLGLNLGTVGFLSSVRTERQFLKGLRASLEGRFLAPERLMLDVQVIRGGREVLRSRMLNEVYVQNPLGMVTLDVRIGATRIQRIRGTGALVATPTGSTGYNLSAHGPIVDPSLHVFIITEILDHDVPTPSVVVPVDRTVSLRVVSFRSRGILSLGSRSVDVILSADGQTAFALQEGDRIMVRRAPHGVAIVQLEPDYFYRSLHEKFSIS